jgi:hypothetical protein
MRTIKRLIKAGVRPLLAIAKRLGTPVARRLRGYFGRELEQQIRTLQAQVKEYRDEVNAAVREIERLVLAFVALAPAGQDEGLPEERLPEAPAMRSAG